MGDRPVSQRDPDPLYRVEVRGGGSFLYDLTDVGRFAKRMAAEGDARAFSIRASLRPVEREGEGG